MNLKKWMRLGGILAVLVGVAPMLAVAQEYGRDRAEERGAIRVDNNRPYYQRDYYRGSHHDNRYYYQRDYYRGSHHDNRYYYQRDYYRGSHHDNRGHYPEPSYRYNLDPHHGYQNR